MCTWLTPYDHGKDLKRILFWAIGPELWPIINLVWRKTYFTFDDRVDVHKCLKQIELLRCASYCHRLIWVPWTYLIRKSMLLLLLGKSEIGPQVWSDIGYLNCLRHLFGSRVVIYIWHFVLLSEKTYLHTCATCSELPSNISTMKKPVSLCFIILHKKQALSTLL